MMKRGKTIRIIVNSILFAIIVTLGITFYQTGKKQEKNIEKKSEIVTTNLDEEKETNEVDTNHVEAEIKEDANLNYGSEIANMEESNNSDHIEEEETLPSNSVEVAENNTLSTAINFDENTLMEWPLEGNILMDYSGEKTVFFKTLNQYKVNPALMIEAQEGDEVKSASAGIITSISEDAQTGTTITMDLGNGYESIYGQLKDLQVVQGEAVDMGTLLGYVNTPTKYYALEGANLYFRMNKDGETLDPILYLPQTSE